jgi:hypothetical protein
MMNKHCVPDVTLTKGCNAELKGSYIKITGDNAAVGITFHNTATQAETRLAMSDIVINEPSRLFVFVPDTLASGEYEVTVATQYSVGRDLKNPRSVMLGIPVVIASTAVFAYHLRSKVR